MSSERLPAPDLEPMRGPIGQPRHRGSQVLDPAVRCAVGRQGPVGPAPVQGFQGRARRRL